MAPTTQVAGTILAIDSVTKASRKGRPNYPMDFKRELAAQACAPDVSVAKLALKHGINANMLFKWRRQYRAGRFDVAEGGKIADPVTLIPVITPEVTLRKPAPAPKRGEPMIEMVIGDVTVRLRGGADAILLSTVLDCLAQRR